MKEIIILIFLSSIPFFFSVKIETSAANECTEKLATLTTEIQSLKQRLAKVSEELEEIKDTKCAESSSEAAEKTEAVAEEKQETSSEINEPEVEVNYTKIAEEKYPGRKSGDTYLKIDAKTEQFPQGGENEKNSCKSKIYNQKLKRNTLSPPFLYTFYDKGLFTAVKFNKCYFSPYHTHKCNKWGDFPHNYKIEYDSKKTLFRILFYKDGTGNTADKAGDVGCKGSVVKTTNWMTLDEFNKKYVQIGTFMNESPFKLATESIDYAAYTTFNSKSSNCAEKSYGERLYYKYDIYWSYNADQDGWYLVQYKVVHKPEDKDQNLLTLGRFDQYWGLYGIDRVQSTWCLDGELKCGTCVGNEYVTCGNNYV